MPNPSLLPTSHNAAIRPLQALLAAAICAPLLLYGGAAWHTYNTAFDEANDHMGRIADIASQQAVNVFQSDELALARVSDHIAGMSWEQIAASNEVHLFLNSIKENLPQASIISLIDPQERVASVDFAFPPPLIVLAPRTYLSTRRPDGSEIGISDVVRGETTGKYQFVVSRNAPSSMLPAPAASISLTMDPSYFADFYDTLGDVSAIHVNLVRTDGLVLVRNPAPTAAISAAADSLLLAYMHADKESGTYEGASQADGVDRLFAFERVPNYPMYVVVGIDRTAVMHGWLRLMGTHLIYGIPVTLLLIGATLIALRRTRRAEAETERRMLIEEQYQHAQKMEAIGQLTGGVAHDFNNLLTVVLGSLEQLERHVTSAAGKRLIELAERGAERGARLTQSLLSFARRQSLRPETVRLNALINEFRELLDRAAGDQVEIQYLLSPAIDPCRIDPTQFQAALLNLVVNARDALSSEGGRISIETGNVRLDETAGADVAPGDYVGITVADTGGGMTAEVLERAFEPFYTTKEIGKGSGLGLSQVYGFVKQTGGHVALASEPGIGTTVRLYFPRAAAETGGAVGESAAGSIDTQAAKAETILVVEDDPDLREMVAENLSSLGYRVLTAENGPVALGLIESDPSIDLLFSDFSMPNGMLGDELARRAKAARDGLKVLLTSGYATTPGGKADDFAILRKPYRQEELAQAVRDALDG
jgi:signal transduction histidine kinase